MAHRYGERQQNMLFPQSIEDYIAEDDPVRVYDAFVDALDWDTLEIICDKCKFQYIPEMGCYVCPEGKQLNKRSYNRTRKAWEYCAGRDVCMNCCHFGNCTNNKTTGRGIQRHDNEAVREKIAKDVKGVRAKLLKEIDSFADAIRQKILGGAF